MRTSTADPRGPLAVLCTMSCKEALTELRPLFERASGLDADISYGQGARIAAKIRAGARADIFVGPEEFSVSLTQAGILAAGSHTAFAHSSAVIAIRAGAPRPDIGSAQALERTLREAKTVCYSTGASGIHFLQACERLGVAQIVAAKLVKPRPGEMVGPVLVRGEADLGVQQPAELLPVAGIEILGPLPAELRQTIVYGASAFTVSNRHQGWRALVDFMRSPAARDALRAHGLEPV